MESLGLYDVVLIVGSALIGAALIATLGRAMNARLAQSQLLNRGALSPVFLFDGDALSDATLDAHKMIKQAPTHQTDRQAVIALFQDRFPTLDYVMSHLSPGTTENMTAADDSGHSLQIEDLEGLVRLTLMGASQDDHAFISDNAAQEGLSREVSFLQDLTNTTPQMIWTQDFHGKLTWANAAYMTLSDQLSGQKDNETRVWPEAAIFPDVYMDAAREPRTQRAMLTMPGTEEELWFDVTSRKTSTGSVHFANSAADAVIAEQSKVKAMQTSARLFSNLASGLAIFDQKRQLAIFNPRLTDLTRLEPRFLTSRPTVDMFLDALRESRVLPEPKDYASWRDQFSALETAAKAGTYCENWELIDGQTFRVTGKPYEDKSFVFLFDDITAEVNLTRRFRTDIETGQGVMDAQDHAIAVFSANGTLVLSNKAYKEMWDTNHESSMTAHQLRSEIAIWQGQSAAGPDWGDLRNYISGGNRGQKWMEHLILENGRDVQCEAEGINANMTMVSFKPQIDQKMSPVLHKLTMSDPSLQSAKG